MKRNAFARKHQEWTTREATNEPVAHREASAGPWLYWELLHRLGALWVAMKEGHAAGDTFTMC